MVPAPYRALLGVRVEGPRMVTEKPEVDSFTRFVVANEAEAPSRTYSDMWWGRPAGKSLRKSWRMGGSIGGAFQGMENPVGYLYVMGRTEPSPPASPASGVQRGSFRTPTSNLPFQGIVGSLDAAADLCRVGALFPVDADGGR